MKKVKFVLPALAFLFAVVASLATVNAKGALVPRTVSLPTNCVLLSGTCETDNATSLCENDDGIVVRSYTAGPPITCGSSFNGIWED